MASNFDNIIKSINKIANKYDLTVPAVRSNYDGIAESLDNLENIPRIVNSTDSGFTDTVQTSTTPTVNNAVNYSSTNTNDTLYGSRTNAIWFEQSYSNNASWDAGVAAVANLNSGDTFTIHWSEDASYSFSDTTYTVSSVSVYGTTSVEVFFSASSPTHDPDLLDSYVHCSWTIGGDYTARRITGSNNPIWDTSLPTVKIGSTNYDTSDWTVSGSTATHNSSAPSISTGDAIEQVNAVHSLGSSGDNKNNLDIYGILSTLKITDGTTNLSLGLSASTIPANLTLGDDQLTFENYKLQLVDGSNTNSEPSIYLTNSTYFQSTGSQYGNVFIGDGVAANIPTSNERRTSTFIGSNAGKGNATNNPSYSRDNTAVGTYAFERYTGSSRENTALGVAALRGSNSAASTDSLVSNTAIGMGSFDSLKNGQYNTGCGKDAGGETSTGNNNLFLGFRAGTYWSPSGRITTGSNIVCLGNTDITDIYCSDTTISSSDARDKTDIEDFTPGLDFVNQLRPVTYRWDKRTWYLPEPSDDPDQPEVSVDDVTPDGTHKQERVNLGFLAQEVEAIEQSYGYATDKNNRLICNLNEDETSYGVKYERLVPVLVNAIKELSDRLEALEAG